MASIKIASDLHFEFHRDGGRTVIRELSERSTDILILAGDICAGIRPLCEALRMFTDRFPQVVYVVGNHEFYQTERQQLETNLRKLEGEFANFHWLECRSVVLKEITLAGASLWFPWTPEHLRYQNAVSDFDCIRDYEPLVRERHAAAIKFFEGLKAAELVVTHYLPSPRSIAPKHAESPLNRFFVCDMTKVIHALSPEVWVHGHTHEPMDYICGKTRVVCNPFGDPTYLNPRFSSDFVFELPSSRSYDA